MLSDAGDNKGEKRVRRAEMKKEAFTAAVDTTEHTHPSQQENVLQHGRPAGHQELIQGKCFPPLLLLSFHAFIPLSLRDEVRQTCRYLTVISHRLRPPRLGCCVVWLVGSFDTKGLKQEMDLYLAGGRGAAGGGTNFKHVSQYVDVTSRSRATEEEEETPPLPPLLNQREKGHQSEKRKGVRGRIILDLENEEWLSV
ncbi:hypothetical protein ABVT39_026907 [Epinephelus coioides]